MSKMEPASNRSGQNPGSSPKSAISASQEHRPSPSESFRPQRPAILGEIERGIRQCRNEDLAFWGAYIIEDLGIVQVDRVVGMPSDFGRDLRSILCRSTGELHDRWADILLKLHVHSAAGNDPRSLLAALCQLAAADWYMGGNNAGE